MIGSIRGMSMSKCKCDCDIQIYTIEARLQNQLTELINMFVRLRRDMAWLEYKITGKDDGLQKLEFELKNGGF